MQASSDNESRAVQKLIAEIDKLDAWRDRVGWRVIYLFGATFAGALTMLVYFTMIEGAHDRVPQPGPRVPGVLRGVQK